MTLEVCLIHDTLFTRNVQYAFYSLTESTNKIKYLFCNNKLDLLFAMIYNKRIQGNGLKHVSLSMVVI
jgi:hypothetical protein